MFYTLKLKRLPSFPALVLFLLSAGLLVLAVQNLTAARPSAGPAVRPCLVIDAGHGGVDSGAVSVGGAKESEINLAIALRVQKMAALFGLKTVMTRTEDKGALDYGAGTYSEHKELVYRTELANNTPGAVLLSIHQNNYPTAQPSGAQVLYGAGEASRTLGVLTHTNLIRCLDPENRRVAAPAGNLYMTSHATCPAILVECGFMSNFAELEKLLTAKYQSSLAAVLTGSCLQFLSGEEAA